MNDQQIAERVQNRELLEEFRLALEKNGYGLQYIITLLPFFMDARMRESFRYHIDTLNQQAKVQ